MLIDENYCRAPRGRLTNRYHGYIIDDKSDEGQDVPSRVEMGNAGSEEPENNSLEEEK